MKILYMIAVQVGLRGKIPSPSLRYFKHVGEVKNFFPWRCVPFKIKVMSGFKMVLNKVKGLKGVLNEKKLHILTILCETKTFNVGTKIFGHSV